MEAAAGADGLEDQEVRDREGELDRRRPGDRAGVEVGRDLRAEALGEDRDLAGLEQAADAAEARLQDADAAGAEQGGELGLGGEALAGGDRHRRLRRDRGEVERRVGRDRLLEPERVEGRDAPGEPDGARRA